MKSNKGERRWLYFPMGLLLCMSFACPDGKCAKPEECGVEPVCDKPEGCETPPPECDKPGGCVTPPPVCDKPEGCDCDKPGSCPPPIPGSIAPNLLISRGKQTRSSVNSYLSDLVTDGRYRLSAGEEGNIAWSTYDGVGQTNQAGWVAVYVGQNMTSLPNRVLLKWHSGIEDYTNIGFGSPTAYSIEVSADPAGADGTWTELVNVSDNKVRTRTHLLKHAAGIAWVRMQIPLSGQAHLQWGAQISQIDVYDATHLLEEKGKALLYDSWFFLGDSITAAAFNQATAHGSFADNVKEQTKGQFFPVHVNGGVAYDNTQRILDRLDSALEEHPNIRFWAIGIGTNNVGGGGNGYGLEDFRNQLSQIIERIQAAGRIPVVANIPFNQRQDSPTACALARLDTPKFNEAVQTVIEKTGARQGPDLYKHFAEKCEQLSDPANQNQEHIHPTATGYKAINQLWADAMAYIYKDYKAP